mmetsp:Transcript_22593/g.45129  ORF Transcript_22593/g.45129 Transcript_22593/m.45129 type:complete len:98 (+) Transcript_22593:151-444(+)
MFPSSRSSSKDSSRDVETARPSSSPSVVTSAMVGNETVIRDKRLTWKERRAKFVKQRGKFESSNESQGAVLSQTLSSPKDKKSCQGCAEDETFHVQS